MVCKGVKKLALNQHLHSNIIFVSQYIQLIQKIQKLIYDRYNNIAAVAGIMNIGGEFSQL